ncbi:MAG: substrate-binding domain-containing protein [Burkholderiales bacterium]|nr:substrate-binding domain-containing protein [Burkholderiales bacterium]
MTVLDWPGERAHPAGLRAPFVQSLSNICLDLHGDPQAAKLVVFSDGNHHMALEPALQAFLADHPDVIDIFYATTPPRVVVEALHEGGITMGNLTVTARPHVFISPPRVLDALVQRGLMKAHLPLAGSRGNTLIVRKGNPRGIHGIADLMREDVKVFLSNPLTETVSYATYAATLRAMAQRLGLTADFLDAKPHPRVVHGESIHHREAPQAVADGRADAAVVFYHLALRYTRIFPGIFELMPLTPEGENDPGQERSRVHIGLVGDGGAWGARLLEFMTGKRVAAIYRHHGLVPVED